MHLTRRLETAARFKSKKQKSKSRWSTLTTPPLLGILAVASLTGTMGQRFYNQPKLDEGTIAPQTIEAPVDATVIDTKATEEKRKEAKFAEKPVLKIDRSTDEKIAEELGALLEEGNQIRQIVAPFLFVDTGILSTVTQGYLRRTSEKRWGKIQQIVEQEVRESLPLPQRQAPSDVENSQEAIAQLQTDGETPRKSSQQKANLLLPGLGVVRKTENYEEAIATEPQAIEEEQQLVDTQEQRAILELTAYRQKESSAEYQELIEKVLSARQRYVRASEMLDNQAQTKLGFAYDKSLLELSDEAWQDTKVGVITVAQKMLAQGISPNFPRDKWTVAVRIQAVGAVPLEAEALAIKILKTSLEANLIEDREGTQKLAELAAQKVKPVEYKVRKGETIVRSRERISRRAFVLLDNFELSRRQINWRGLKELACLVIGAVGVVLLVESKFNPRLRKRDHLLLLLLTLSSPLLVAVGVPWTSLPAVGLLVGSFYGSAMGVTVVGLLSALVPFGMEVEAIHWLASAMGGLVGSVVAPRLRSREELALLGVVVGLTHGVVYLLLSLIVSGAAGSIWYSILGLAALEAVMGLGWSVVALGLSPYLEHVFDLIVPIRLAELANPNRPLLKRLVSEAPGTFQHTMFVASLAEAAARELGCNVELVRTGTLYHDIGKMHDPLGFIENQMGGPNKHDEIDDPWVSVEIIKKHVSEGLVMARKYRLPKAIQAFIPEHQGTMLIAYFYYQAKQRMEKEGIAVLEEDFRYEGPIPQSRETGILMLADSCEAALRSLKDATHDDALQMVNKILKARWVDNQLVDSGIQKEEMPKIAEIFVQVWQQYNHKRIAYPKAALKD